MSEESKEDMVKEAVVRPGMTPSVHSGLPSEEVRRDKQAYAKGEPAVDSIEDLANDL